MADSIPSTLTAGESLSLSLAFPGYLASAGWALKWINQGSGTTRVTVTATAETDAFRLKLSAENSLLLRGACPWQIWVTKTDDSHLVDSGSLAVSAGLANHHETGQRALSYPCESCASVVQKRFSTTDAHG